MDNYFLTRYFDWDAEDSARVQMGNRLLTYLGVHARLSSPTQSGQMTSVEQRINLYHLLSQQLTFKVPGAVVELGCHQGQSAALFRMILNRAKSDRELHVFDAFVDPAEEAFRSTFTRLGLAAPEIHAGWFEDTVPDQLPETIAFCHIDAGPGYGEDGLRRSVLHCLRGVYDRLAPLGVCVLADYANPAVFESLGMPTVVARSRFWDHLPGVKAACDEFFIDKPEVMESLYGGPYSQGFFRKLSS